MQILLLEIDEGTLPPVMQNLGARTHLSAILCSLWPPSPLQGLLYECSQPDGQVIKALWAQTPFTTSQFLPA